MDLEAKREIWRKFGKISGNSKKRKLGYLKHLKINLSFLRKALSQGGMTIGDFVRQWNVSRQVCYNFLRKNIGKIEKEPLWYAKRLGKPELADRVWLEKTLRQTGSVSILAKEIGISPFRLITHLRRLGISRPEVQAERLIITCTVCGKVIERPRYRFRSKKGIAFCNKKCQRRWLERLERGNKSAWREDEIEFLRKYGEKISDVEIAKQLGRSVGVVNKKRLRLHIRKQERGVSGKKKKLNL